MTDHLKMHSLNKIDENISKIARIFPNCVTEAKDENGEIKPKIKISENVAKITTPCFKQVHRLYDKESGKSRSQNHN